MRQKAVKHVGIDTLVTGDCESNIKKTHKMGKLHNNVISL